MSKQDEEKFIADWLKYKDMYTASGMGNFEVKEEYLFPCLYDYRNQAGDIDAHYFPMDIFTASAVIKSGVKNHMDVGSRIDGFVAHLLASGINVTEMDIRPLIDFEFGYGAGKLTFVQGDATNLNNITSNSVESISSLHAIEHFGLGRYGDEVNPNACFEAMNAMKRVLKPGGILYLAVPVGKTERVCFNAHRVFRPDTIISSMSGLVLNKLYIVHDFKICEFDSFDDSVQNLMSEYDCGIFIFSKRQLTNEN